MRRSRDDRPERHSFIESAEILGPVFSRPLDYGRLKALGDTDAFRALSTRAAALAATSSRTEAPDA